MQIVINISEKDYQALKQGHVPFRMLDVILKGTPLPSKHGRLIDETKADGLIAEGKDGNKAYFGTLSKDWEVIDFLKTVPTVIEADNVDEKK